MSVGPVRKLFVLAVIGGAVAALVRTLRGGSTPAFAGHPTVDGGPRPGSSTPAGGATATSSSTVTGSADAADAIAAGGSLADRSTEPGSGDNGASAVVESTLAPVADVAGDETPAAGLAADVVADAPGATDAAPGEAAGLGDAWALPVAGDCPPGYPVKAKLASGIFHLPGMFAYDRTTPDRCYRSAADAEADGLRPAKR